MSDHVLSEYLLEVELAKQLRRCTRTLKRWRDCRVGPPVTKVGSTIYYRRDGVHKWLLEKEEVRRARRR